MIPCPECGGPSDIVENPPRYALPKTRGVCRDCGHEWNIVSPVEVRRYTQ